MRITALAITILAIFSTSVYAAAPKYVTNENFQKTVQMLQSQLKQVQTEANQALTKQSAATHKSLQDLISQVQSQITTLHSQIQTVQSQNIKSFKTIQKQLDQLAEPK